MKSLSAFIFACTLAVLAGNSTAFAVPVTSNTDWGNFGPPDIEAFGNVFDKKGTYIDNYAFTLGAPASTFGGVIEINTLFNKLDIDVVSVSLFKNGNLLSEDTSPLFFSF